MISCDTSLPRRSYEARRVSTASSSGTLVLSVGQPDCKEASAIDAVESQFFRHYLLLLFILSFEFIYQATKKKLDPEKYDVWEQFVNSDRIHLLFLISKHKLLVYFLE